MIFGDLPLDRAEGAILAHTRRLATRVLKKGQVLDAESIAALRESGRTHVIAALLEPGDVGENDAAARMATALAAPRLRASRAATGRVNLFAEATGLLRIDTAAIDRLNLIDPSLTVATLPDCARVAAGEMLATIKVIPFAAPGEALTAFERAAAAHAPPFTLHPFKKLTAGLVLSELPGLKERIFETTVAATEARITALGGRLLPPLRCPHDETAIAACLDTLIAGGADLLLIAGASAVVDRRDVAPAAIERAGGEIRHFGMPVDPGNLICIGRIGDRPALVLPGCARSPKSNGIDWVLQRLYAGLDVDGPAVMRMGVGGLLKDIDTRPLPRARAVAEPPRSRRVAAIVLAAGRSSRMAPHNKLLLTDSKGQPMVARVIDRALSSRARPILAVLGHRAEDVRAALGGRPVTPIVAEAYAEGLSASLKAGIAAVPTEAEAALVLLGDMPLVTGRVIDRLIDAYDPDEGRLIIVPTHRGQHGNPVLWDRRFFPDIATLSGDAGARQLLSRHGEHVAEIEVDDDSVLRDFDTVESFATLPARLRPVL